MREVSVTDILVLWLKGLLFYFISTLFLSTILVSYLWMGFCLEDLKITNQDDETDEYLFLILAWPLVLYRIKTNT